MKQRSKQQTCSRKLAQASSNSCLFHSMSCAAFGWLDVSLAASTFNSRTWWGKIQHTEHCWNYNSMPLEVAWLCNAKTNNKNCLTNLLFQSCQISLQHFMLSLQGLDTSQITAVIWCRQCCVFLWDPSFSVISIPKNTRQSFSIKTQNKICFSHTRKCYKIKSKPILL